MGYERHSTFLDPENVEQRLWRYLDLSKFAHLLATSRLHFTRIDRFRDPFEGSASPLAADELVKAYERSCEVHEIPKESRHSSEEIREEVLNTNELRAQTFASCWHLNDWESAAMWAQYLASGEGIAICTSYDRFKRCFESVDEPVYVGAVRYIDYDFEGLQDPGNLFSCVLHKRRSFEHEREVRAVVSRWGPDDVESPEEGIDLPVSPSELIEKVYVAPGTGQWFTDTVLAVVRAFNFSFPVERSKLLDAPPWLQHPTNGNARRP